MIFNIIEITISLLVTWFAFFIGSIVFRKRLPDITSAEFLLLSISMGYGIIAYFMSILAKCQLLYSLLIWIVMLSGIIISILCNKLTFKKILINWRIEWSFLNIFLLIILSIVVFFGGSLVFVPVFGVDAESYHLALGSLFRFHHGEIPLDFWFYGYWPHLTEMIHLWCTMLYKSSILNQIINFKLFLLCAVGIYILLIKYIPKKIAFMGSVIFCVSTDSFMREYLIGPKEEFFILVFSLSSYIAYLKYLETRDKFWLILIGCYIGFAASCKMLFGLIPAVAFFTMFIFSGVKEQKTSLKRLVQNVVIIGSIFTAISLSWYWGQISHHGNPFYPLNIFHSISTGDVTSVGTSSQNFENDLVFRHRKYIDSDTQGVRFFFEVIKGFILFLFRMTFDREVFLWTCSPIFIFSLLIWIFSKFRIIHGTNHFIIFTISLYIIYFLGPANTRRYLPLFVGFTIWSSIILASLKERRKMAGNIVTVIVCLLIAMDTYTNYIKPKPHGGIKKYFPTMYSENARDNFLKQNNYGHNEVYEYIENTIPKTAKIFIYPLVPGYRLDRDYIWGDKLHAGKYMRYSEMKSHLQLLSRLQELKVTHLFLNAYIFKNRPSYKEDLINEYVNKIVVGHSDYCYGHGSSNLYEIKYSHLNGIKEQLTIKSEKIEDDKFNVYLSDFSKEKEYKVLLSLKVYDLNELKTNSSGFLTVKKPHMSEFNTAARIYLNVNVSLIKKDVIHCEAMISKSIDKNGLYQFVYKHTPAYGRVELIGLNILEMGNSGI